jgi:2-keto-3-deoxy-galactonokinase
MNDGEKTGEDLCAIYIDMGTTNTRAWLMRGDEVLARASKPLGVRDSAHDGSTRRIRTALKELISRIASDRDAFVERGVLAGDTQVVVSGHAVIAEAWASALARMSISATVLTEEETEKAFLSGLRCVLSRTIAVERMGH